MAGRGGPSAGQIQGREMRRDGNQAGTGRARGGLLCCGPLSVARLSPCERCLPEPARSAGCAAVSSGGERPFCQCRLPGCPAADAAPAWAGLEQHGVRGLQTWEQGDTLLQNEKGKSQRQPQEEGGRKAALPSLPEKACPL